MAWLWWLLAPVLSTIAGGFVLTLRSSAEHRPARRDAIAEHRALLAALPQPKPGESAPVTMRVLEPDHAQSPPG